MKFRWKRKLFKLLPQSMRHTMARDMVKVPVEISKQLQLKIAQTQEELEAAFRILHDAYVKEGYMQPHPSGLRVTKYHALPTTTTIIAKWNGQVIGTLSIIRDSGMGLPIDAAYDLGEIRKKYLRIAEVSSLAIDKNFRFSNGAVLWPLLKYFYIQASEYMNLDAVVCACHPNWSDFYTAIMGFECLREKIVEKYDFANGSSVAGFILDLKSAPMNYAKKYLGKEKRKDLHSFFLGPTSENFVRPDRRYNKSQDPVLNPDLMEYFFNQRTQVFADLSEREKMLISASYPDREFQNVIPISTFKEQRDLRFQVECRARDTWAGAGEKLQVLNVSRNGMMVHGNLQNDVLNLQVAVSDFCIAGVRAKVVWQDSSGCAGLRIIEANDAWQSFLDYLHDDFATAADTHVRYQQKSRRSA